jgi:hypothetical protein
MPTFGNTESIHRSQAYRTISPRRPGGASVSGNSGQPVFPTAASQPGTEEPFTWHL